MCVYVSVYMCVCVCVCLPLLATFEFILFLFHTFCTSLRHLPISFTPPSLSPHCTHFSIIAGGWLFMYALTFFCMSWGPLSSVFLITAELFPTKWRATGKGEGGDE